MGIVHMMREKKKILYPGCLCVALNVFLDVSIFEKAVAIARGIKRNKKILDLSHSQAVSEMKSWGGEDFFLIDVLINDRFDD